jgi:RHS repeat-associated protein
VVITYNYDPLYRLTEANYSTGEFYHYTYDEVGNRLTEETHLESHDYVYDAANRLSSVDTVSYTFDDNGNLLDDGTSTYTYDAANRLSAVSGPSSATYTYNGLGDRYQQTVNSTTTTYVLDLNAGLTQVLDDGDSAYLYGLGRVAQVNGSTDYFMGDALDSVRQLVEGGDIVLAKSYAPYGEDLYSTGSAESTFAFTGEQTDPNGLVYLRARYYGPSDGRFLSRDSWAGDINSPLSLNRWNYVEGNPVNYMDPSGYCPVLSIDPSGYCLYTMPTTVNFDGTINPGITFRVPEIICILFGLESDDEQVQIAVTVQPSKTPGPATSTPEEIQTQVNGTQTPKPTQTPQPTPGPRVTLYRAIDLVELSYVMATGTYGFSPHGGGKYFAFTLAGVINFAKSNFNAEKEMTITSTDVPDDLLAKGYPFNDVGGAGASIHFSDAILAEFYLAMSPIRILGSP